MSLLVKLILIVSILAPSTGMAKDRPYGSVDAYKAIKPIVIDGVLDDWAEVKWIEVSEGASFVSGNEFNSLSDDGASEPAGTALTDADLSSKISLRWDEEYLYIAANVIDNVRDLNPTAHESVWYLRDAVTLFLDVPKDGDGAPWISGDHSFSFTADNEITNWWRHGDVTGHRELPMPNSVKSVVVQGSEGNYLLEAAIPMEILNEFTPDWVGPFEGKEIGFLLLLTDMDGTNAPIVAQLMYGGDGDHDGTWSTLRLVDKSSTEDIVKKDFSRLSGNVISTNSGARWTDGEIQVVSEDGAIVKTISVKTDGFFESYVPAGKYRLFAGGNSIEINIRAGASVDGIILEAEPVVVNMWFPDEPTSELIELYKKIAIPIMAAAGFLQAKPNENFTNIYTDNLFEVPNIQSFRKSKKHVETSLEWRQFSSLVLHELGVTSGSLLAIKSAPASYVPNRPTVYEDNLLYSERVIKAGKGNLIADWRFYGIPDGLNRQRVESIDQTSNGNLWFAAFANLLSNGSTVVYDGENFREVMFQENSYGGLISRDAIDNVWISGIIQDGTGWEFSLKIFDGTKWKALQVPEEISSAGITVMNNSPDGATWLGTSHGVIKCIDQSMQLLTVDDGLLGNGVISILPDSKGNIWFGTLNGVSVYDGEQFTNFTAADGLSNEHIRVLAEDLNGQVWLGTDRGLYSIKNDKVRLWTRKTGLPEVKITALNVDEKGVLWIGTDVGLYQYDESSSTGFHLIGDMDQVLDLFEDVDGYLWAATHEGMARYEKSRTREITEENGITYSDISHIESADDGSIVFSSDTAISKYDLHRDSLQTIAAPGEISSMTVDKFGTEWIATKDGVFFLKNEKWLMSNSIGSSHMFETALIEDFDGQLWHQSQFGISYLSDNGQWKAFDSGGFFEGEGFGLIPGLISGNNGLLWFRGVPKRNKNFIAIWDGSVWKSFDHYAQSPKSRPTCALRTPDNTIWFGTEKEGLFKFSNGEFKRFSVEDGSAPPFITSILEDQQGRLWLSSRGGGLTIFDGNSSQTVSTKDGLLSNVVTGVIEDNEGCFWIATNSGISIYNPSNQPPPIRIIEVIADNRYDTSDEIVIPSSQEYISIRFKGTSFKTRSESMKYSIRLLNETQNDTSWSTIEENTYEISDLPTGKYIFEVRAIDRDLNYSTQAAKVEFEVIYIPEASSIGLGEVEVEDIYASFYKTYGVRSAGNAQVFNKNERPIDVTLQYYLPELMLRPTVKRFTIPPRSKLIHPFKAHLDNRLLEFSGQKVWQAEVKLSYDVGVQTISVEKKIPLQIYGRGALTWDKIEKAAAFVTPEHPPVVSFARGLLATFDDSNIKNISNKNILRSMLMFEGLNSLGVKYAPDANTPFQEARDESAVLDNIQYPYESMTSLLGDCDDNTVLFCSLLENLKIPTAFIDVPGHILMMFDSGIASDRPLGLLLPESMFVDYRGSLWVPIEVTVLGEDRLFMDAWELGAKIVGQFNPEIKDRFTIVSEAWRTYPYGDLEETYTVDLPIGELLRKSLRDNLNLLEKMQGEYFEKTYVAPLIINWTDEPLRLKMAKAHIESNNFRLALSQLPLIAGSLKGEALYLTGYSYAGLGNFDLAAKYIENALKIDPEHAGYMESLCWVYLEMILASRQ